jgi:hypothetical protein
VFGNALQRTAVEEGLQSVLACQFALQPGQKVGGGAGGITQPFPAVGVGMPEVCGEQTRQVRRVRLTAAGEQFSQQRNDGWTGEKRLIEEGCRPFRVVAGEDSVCPCQRGLEGAARRVETEGGAGALRQATFLEQGAEDGFGKGSKERFHCHCHIAGAIAEPDVWIDCTRSRW